MTLPVIDSHVHLWHPERFPMPWLVGNAVLDRPFEPDAFSAQTGGLNVAGLVYVEVAVEPAFALLEARHVADLAERTPLIQGIVAHAPLEYGTRTRSYLAALRNLGPKVKGVRRLLQGEPDPKFCLRDDFIAGVRLLPKYRFSFDICVVHTQLPAVIELVRRCPDTTFILDHLGKPDAKGGRLELWCTHIQTLAALPNVACKLSGLVTEADHRDWTPAGLEPYISHVLACFGDRTLFGSDWPVVLQAATYGRWLAVAQRLTEHLSADARTQLFSSAAKNWYRLEP
ncbi:MAG: L-fuconolactone hydrolase [uncultured Truepera sp.]|uniref:L-fuconolactone hydrolase n=1 Tax=uncultured Truepera sp. TaxID=543023 RepID=A0A6J4VWH0_9DEIN|nr:MAG: L-fuconolactone hydrolase [uncultured Truepera sp.]